MKRYFYITIHFFPKYEGTIFKPVLNDLYQNIDTGEMYRKRLLYDFGWGQEDGFELLPQLSFDKLIGLLEQPLNLPKKRFGFRYTKGEIKQAEIYRSNLYGAVAVIMQDHVEKLIDFLAEVVDTDYFEDQHICENYKCFSFDSSKVREEGKIPGGILNQSYEEILMCYPKWREISDKIVDKIYK